MGSMKKEEKTRIELSKNCFGFRLVSGGLRRWFEDFTVFFNGSPQPFLPDWIIATNVYTNLSTSDFVQ